MKRRFYYNMPPWLRQFRDFCAQLIIPITVLQLIRTLLLPSTFDVIILAVFVFISVALTLDWI